MMKTKLILLTAFFSLMIGCSSDEIINIENSQNDDIYLLGFRDFGLFNVLLEKNNVEIDLDNNTNTYSLDKFFVENNDVYVMGVQGTNAVVWKNGTIVWQATNERPTDFSVQNGDIYVLTRKYNCICHNEEIKYWINNQSFNVHQSFFNNKGIVSAKMIVKNNDIHIVVSTGFNGFNPNYQSLNYTPDQVYYILNNNLINITQNNFKYFSQIVLDTNNELMIVNNEKYWKNNQVFSLTNSYDFFIRTSSNLYRFNRYNLSSPYYQKNNDAIQFLDIPANASHPFIKDISDKNNDVYILGGYTLNNNLYYAIWKNNIIVQTISIQNATNYFSIIVK